MNEGWATYWHSKLMTESILDASEIIDYADHAAGVLATSGGRLNPYKLGVELYRNIEERWDRGQFGKEWEECDDLEAKKNWNLRLGLGRKKIFEVRVALQRRHLHRRVLDARLRARQQALQLLVVQPQRALRDRDARVRAVKEKLLFQLTNGGNPFIYVEDANYENRGELLLKHDHQGLDLRQDYAKEVMRSLLRVWKRPVSVQTIDRGQAGRAPLRRQGAHVAPHAPVGGRMGQFVRDPEPLVAPARPDEWIRAGLAEVRRAASAYARGDLRGGAASVKRAAGMGLNGALIVEPDERWGRSYVDHVHALSVDTGVPEAVRAACRAVLAAGAAGARSSCCALRARARPISRRRGTSSRTRGRS